MNPIMTVDRSTPFNKYVYMQASNPTAATLPMENVVKSIVVVCGQEKVALKD